MHYVHPAVVVRQVRPQAKVTRGPSLLDLRLLQWPSRREILEEFAAAQRLLRPQRISTPAANEPPDDVA